jgi:PKD repeat protein
MKKAGALAKGNLRSFCVALLVGVLLLGALLSAETLPARASTAYPGPLPGYGVNANSAADPVGGGPGYRGIITGGDYICATGGELLEALSKASSGDVIFVPSAASVDLTGSYGVSVPAGITIASDRGLGDSPGGRIFTSSMTAQFRHLFEVGSYVTFSGLRLEGPDGSQGSRETDPTITGIYSAGSKGLVVENCEIYNWPFAGVAVYNDGVGGINNRGRFYIHHNYFHHNRREGYGYGVDTAGSSGLIEANSFDYGRHYIAGGRGFPVNHVETRFNVFGPNCSNALYDQHGGNDDPSWGFDQGPDLAVPAGGTLFIHHNTFRSGSQPSVAVRGVPYVACEVYNNWTLWPESQSAKCFKQRLENLDLKPYRNMSVHDNWYGVAHETSFTTSTGLQADFSVGSAGTSNGSIVVLFTNMSSGGVPPVTCTWDFENDGVIDSTEWQPRHSYGKPGTYTVSLTVMDVTRDADTEVRWNCLAVVSSSGATVETADGQVTAEFPGGAVIDIAMVSMETTSADGLPGVAEGFAAGDTCFAILALDGSGGIIADLAEPVTITVKYSQSDLAAAGGNAGNLVLAYWDESAGEWKVLDTIVNKKAMTLTASTAHLSAWAVLASTAGAEDQGVALWIWVLVGIGGVVIAVIVLPRCVSIRLVHGN